MSTNENMYIINIDSGSDKASPKISQFTHNAECIKLITKRNLSGLSVFLISSIENCVTMTLEGEHLTKNFNEETGETEILWYPTSEITAKSGCVIYQLAAYDVQNNDEVWYSCEGRLIVTDSVDTTDHSANLLGGEPNLLIQLINLLKSLELCTQTLKNTKVDKEDGMGLSQNSFTDEHVEKLNKTVADIKTITESAPENLNTISKLASAIGNNPNFSEKISSDVKVALESSSSAVNSVSGHIAQNNPHAITKDTIGLGNVDNTSDEGKPLSKAARDALDKKFDKADALTKLDTSALITDYSEGLDKEDIDKYVPSFGLFANLSDSLEQFVMFDNITANMDGAIPGVVLVPTVGAVEDYVHSQLYVAPENTIPSTLEANKEYYLGKKSDIMLIFPTIASEGDTIYLNFETGNLAASIGVDLSNTTDEFDLIPEPEMGYEIYAKYNGRVWILSYSEYKAPIDDNLPVIDPEIPDIEEIG